LAKRVHVEVMASAVGRRHRLRLEVDRDRQARLRVGVKPPIGGRTHRAETLRPPPPPARGEPQPKFSAATTIFAPRNSARFRTNSGFSEPSALKRTSWKRKLGDSDTLRVLRRKRAGITRSVSTFGRSMGTAT